MKTGGVLVLVVGPSGAGKDTLLDAARRALADDTRFHFVRRVITRPAEAGGEAHEAVTPEEFAGRRFALSWEAHGLRYGIPEEIADDLARGCIVVANVSRGVIEAAVRGFSVRVIEIAAPASVLEARLAARGREGAEQRAARLARQVTLPEGVTVATVVNDATPEDGAARFLAALSLAAEAAAPR